MDTSKRTPFMLPMIPEKVKWQPTEWGVDDIICKLYICKGLAVRVHKEFLQLNYKKINTQLKMGKISE